MPAADSKSKFTADPDQLALARTLLATPRRAGGNGTVVLAAAFAAASALALATATILVPAVGSERPVKIAR